jgi:hypothetical protein
MLIVLSFMGGGKKRTTLAFKGKLPTEKAAIDRFQGKPQ